jgi:hypothetical protein
MITSRRMRLAGRVARMGDTRNAYKTLVGKHEGKRPCRRPRRRWKYNIRMQLKEMGLEVMDCKHLDEDRDQWQVLVSAVVNLRVL